MQPIKGTWFEFQHPPNPYGGYIEGKYWNEACARFSARQWMAKIQEIAEIGFEHLVLMHVAECGKVYYPTALRAKHDLACENPFEILLHTADQLDLNVFVGVGYFTPGGSDFQTINEAGQVKIRLSAMNELAEQYGHHPSFSGWYWPHEAHINKRFSEHYVEYVNTCSHEARILKPQAKVLIAPYGVRTALPDEDYVRQISRLDVDIIAYQDGVGVRTNRPEEIAPFYEGLRKAHDQVPEIALWADMEVFEFESEVCGKSPLIPAEFSRIEKQIQAISPFVETILIYQYQGMMNKPDSPAFAGHVDSIRLYQDYVAWLEKHFPERLSNRLFQPHVLAQSQSDDSQMK